MKLIWDVACLLALVAVFAAAQWRGMEVLQTIRILTAVSVALRAVYYLLLLRIIMRFRERHSAQAQAA